MTFLQLLEAKYFGQLTESKVFDFAKSNDEFVSQWLVHCIRSSAEISELRLVLAFSDKWNIDALILLESYLDEISPFYSLIKNTGKNETLIKSIVGEFSYERVCKILTQIEQLQIQTDTDSNSVDIQMTQLCIPQTMLDKIVLYASPKLHDASLFGDNGPGSKDNSIRNNLHFPTPLPNALIELALIERILSIHAHCPIGFAEPSVILKYGKGQYYKWHYDHIYPHNKNIQQQVDQFGQRKTTAIFYINDNFVGGETEFKSPFVSVSPRSGKILSFNNCDDLGKRFTESIHRGAEVSAGEKWIITLWFRTKPFWLRSGLLTE